MPTIKGGITIKAGQPIPKQILDTTKLGFKADGWKSEQNGNLVEPLNAEKQAPSPAPVEVKPAPVKVPAKVPAKVTTTKKK